MMTPESERAILHLRVHSDTGGAEMATMPGQITVVPEADGDFCLTVPLADRADAPDVLKGLMRANLELVSIHRHPA